MDRLIAKTVCEDGTVVTLSRGVDGRYVVGDTIGASIEYFFDDRHSAAKHFGERCFSAAL